MRKRLGHLLKRWAALYGFVSSVYSTLSPLHLRELLFGTRVREKYWATRHLHRGNDWKNTRHVGEDDEWVLSYWDSRTEPHRVFLLKRVCNYSPFPSILEIGCNCGPNLYLVAKEFPDVEIRGIDINPRAIQKGKELFASEGISNVKLSVGKADELGQFQDKSFDIVFTDAVLIYVGRDKIKKVIQEMLRVTRRVLILVERHSFEHNHKDPHGLGVYHQGLWLRDYTALLKQFAPEEQICIAKISEDMWPEREWQETGGIIEVKL